MPNSHLGRQQQLYRMLEPATSEIGRLLVDDAYPAALIADLYGKPNTNEFLHRFSWATYDAAVDDASFLRLKNALARFDKVDNHYVFYCSSLQLIDDRERDRLLRWSEVSIHARAPKTKNVVTLVNYLIMYMEQSFNVEKFAVSEDSELTVKINELIDSLADIFAQSQNGWDKLTD